jgi:CHAT domain-containing protein/tetratricopeptide (TPR) repeat protein
LRYIKLIFITLIVFGCFKTFAQCTDELSVWKNIDEIENDPKLSLQQKLKKFYSLKDDLTKCNQNNDSVYARILLKIGYLEYHINTNYESAIQYIERSVQINISAKNKGSKFFATKGYFILARYYLDHNISNKSLAYYDSAIMLAKTFPDTTTFLYYSKYNKVIIHFQSGDYQKAIDESIDGMHYALLKKDTSAFLAFLNQKAQSLYFENRLSSSLEDLETVISIAKSQNNLDELASALKTKAMILKINRNFFESNTLFDSAILIRVKTKDNTQVALDYIDYGNFFLDSLHDFEKAKSKYLKAIEYARKANDSTTIALANINTGEIYLDQKLYVQANDYCVKAFAYLNMAVADNISENPTADQLNAVVKKQLPVVIMNNKIETLLGIYLNTKSEAALTGCLQTCLVMDTLVSKMRHMQLGSESKLYWRDYTRNFYTNAIEASYIAKRSDLAFFFMEKSRAVLLNDKLNELGASSLLSKTDDNKQENYQIKIVDLEQKLSAYADTSQQYRTTQLQLLNVKNEFDQFIKSLEQKYPAYYQYKYADEVPSLQDLQQYLAKNNQTFVYYFMGDTATYILAITPSTTMLRRLSQKEFDKKDLSQFLQLCANQEMLNNHYDAFATLSNSIYKNIFQSLDLPKGRVIICSDNIVVPFDALCTDAYGKNFLLNDYSFSYVYSARFLMKQFKNATPTGNFIGFAPVSFANYLEVNDLKNAAEALHASASYYKKNKLYTQEAASKHNFFKYASSYSIISIFSHARADTTDNEPVLFMRDSLIHLSELQLLSDPAAKLVILSACQTNVGRSATGEGIYSLARGFATAGIPSVAATLWKADEQTIYSVSAKFNEYLSEGMTKDEALQKAKLYFIKKNDIDKLLPYYWANMIVIGNTDTINLTTTSNNWWWIAVGIFVALILLLFIFRKKLL